MSNKGNRRSVIGLIDRQHQLRFSFYLIGGGITALMLTCLYLLVALEKNIQAVLEKGQVPADVSEALMDHVGRVEINISVVSLLLMAVSVFLGVRLSHRIYGPIVQFRRHVGNMVNGDYSSRVNLRDHDHFFELSEDLNVLAESLQKGRQA